ncbi:hypothetical protein OF83DRAFT_793132 [Amylostereum chailletii]|nr:hypothetical protein OF83DRAFT_793132 [Amylostereum chailletii]
MQTHISDPNRDEKVHYTRYRSSSFQKFHEKLAGPPRRKYWGYVHLCSGCTCPFTAAWRCWISNRFSRNVVCSISVRSLIRIRRTDRIYKSALLEGQLFVHPFPCEHDGQLASPRSSIGRLQRDCATHPCFGGCCPMGVPVVIYLRLGRVPEEAFTFFSRITCLLSVIFVIIHNDISRRSWCRTSSVLFLVFGSVSIALASFIVILRIIAIWNRNVVVSVFSICMWLTSAALNLRVPLLTRSSWHVSLNTCDIVTDGAFDPEGRVQGICRFLYYQGVVWLSVAFVVEVPAVVLVLLDLDDPLNLEWIFAGLLSSHAKRRRE